MLSSNDRSIAVRGFSDLVFGSALHRPAPIVLDCLNDRVFDATIFHGWAPLRAFIRRSALASQSSSSAKHPSAFCSTRPLGQQINIAILVFNLGSSMRAKANQPVDSLVGERIRLLRKRRKMSQAELGKAIGVTFQQIQKYENGTNRIGAGRLHLVATSLNVPIAELFDSVA